MQTKSIKLNSSLSRAALVVAALVLLMGVIISAAWHTGNAAADSARQFDAAETAVFLAPSDPLAHAKLATLKMQSFVPTALAEALAEAERAAALAPNDWRYWYALARMHERLGNGEKAELAARRAAELAPNYAQSLWLYGNILLRRGETDEAFAALRRAAQSDSTLAVHFVNTAAQILKTNDFNRLRQTIGDTPEVNAALVNYLIQDKKVDEEKFEQALTVWRGLPNKEKSETAKDLAAALLNAKQYRNAVEIAAYAAADEAEKPAVGNIINADLESDGINKGAFSWQIADGAQPNIAFDATQKHGGARSLIMLFNSVTGQEFRAISQTVAVDGNANYNFSVFAKTGALQTGNTVFWEIADAADNKVLAKTPAVPVGDSDWQQLSATFTTGETTQAVSVRLVRVACTAPGCSITGRIWFDNFSLVKK